MEKVRLLFFLLGVIGPGGGTLLIVGLPNTVNVPENTPAATKVYSFTVNSTSLLSVGPEIVNSNPLTKAFRIEYFAPTYYVVATGDPTLDYETMPNSFDLQIYMIDQTSNTDLETLTIQLTDVNEPPVFLDNLANQAVTVYIIEETGPGVIYQVLATDPDNTTSNLMYTLSPATPFTISSTGSVFSSKKIDYETDPHSYILNVTVTDNGGLSINGNLIVIITNINDNAPYFTTTNTSFSIPEEQYPGTIVANITAVDPDAVGFVSTLYYSISPSQYFSINQLTGTLQIAKTIDMEAATFRLNPVITLNVIVTDLPTSGLSSSITLTITILDINDNPPTCSPYAFSYALLETAANGTEIVNLAGYCSDIDVETQYNTFNFTGLSGLGSNQRFQLIPSASGKIVLTGNLDFEDPANLAVGNEYNLQVKVQDIAFPYQSQIINVYVKTEPVDEFPPVFNSSSYVFNVSELEPARSAIGQVYATDKDYPYIGISYKIVSGGGTLDASNVFWMDQYTGQIQLANMLDYETTRQYLLTVQATDSYLIKTSTVVNSYLKTSTVSVTVNVLEANDEKPICVPNSYTLSVPVDQATGSVIQNFKLQCTDRDSGPTSFIYSINSGNVNNHFAFSPSAGSNVSRLVLANPFDYSGGGADKTWNYNLRVYITDGNLLSASAKSLGVVQTGTVSLYINVYIPGLTTTVTTTTPSVIYVVNTTNVYSATAWYIPFVITLGAMLLLGLLGLLGYLIAKYCPCRSSPKPDTEMLIKPVEKPKVKKDVVWEMTKINTVFDGEAVDPITGNVYEYNSKSGARRWKDTKQPMSTAPAAQPAAAAVSPAEQRAPPPTATGNPSNREKTPITANKGEEGRNTAKPATPKKPQSPIQASPYAENMAPPSRVPMSPQALSKSVS